MVTLEERLARIPELRARGCNCSRCIVEIFSDSPEAAAMAEGLGGGVGGLQQTCGCVTAIAMLDGILKPGGTKAERYERIRRMASLFERKNGSTVCYKLKKVLERPCDALIADAVTLIHRHYCENTEE